MKFPRPLFGLRNIRFFEWLVDIAWERPGLDELYHMVIMSVRAVLTPVSRRTFLHRMRICYRCPVFNHQRRSCRQGAQGCGCYVPYKALAPVDCWSREQNPQKGWGVADAS